MEFLEPDFMYNRRQMGSWWRVLLSGIVLYILGLEVLLLTNNPNLFPTVVLIGNFMIPVTHVTFLYYRPNLFRKLTMPTVMKSFFYGGVLGVFAASLLEPLFVSRLNFGNAFVVGLIEEFAKIIGVLYIARRHCHNSELNGLVVGAAAGMGFAALESTGYAFSAFLRSGGSLSFTVAVTLIRGALTPVGHGTWTAILTSVLYRESAAGRFLYNEKVWLTYFVVSVLHGLWDGWAYLAGRLALAGWGSYLGEILIGVVGLLILWRRWQEAVRLHFMRRIGEPCSGEE